MDVGLLVKLTFFIEVGPLFSKCELTQDPLTLLAHSAHCKQYHVAPGDLSVLPVDRSMQQKARDGDKANTGQPHITTERQSEDVGHEG